MQPRVQWLADVLTADENLMLAQLRHTSHPPTLYASHPYLYFNFPSDVFSFFHSPYLYFPLSILVFLFVFSTLRNCISIFHSRYLYFHSANLYFTHNSTAPRTHPHCQLFAWICILTFHMFVFVFFTSRRHFLGFLHLETMPHFLVACMLSLIIIDHHICHQ